jgi:hypothetical protein
LETQTGVIAEFPDLPSHNRVVLEFLRLRRGQIQYEQGAGGQDLAALGRSRGSLQTCVENLGRLITLPELADDRLASSSLPDAYDALSRVLADAGETEQAEKARESRDKMRSTAPDGRRYPWSQ